MKSAAEDLDDIASQLCAVRDWVTDIGSRLRDGHASIDRSPLREAVVALETLQSRLDAIVSDVSRSGLN